LDSVEDINTKMMANQKRNLKIPLVLAVIAIVFYLLSIYMQFQQTGANG